MSLFQQSDLINQNRLVHNDLNCFITYILCHAYFCILYVFNIIIKTHNSESRGQEEAATTEWIIYMDHH